jgi:hypothetical protein
MENNNAIMLIEDPEERRRLTDMFGRLGFTAMEAGDVIEFLLMTDREKPACVIADDVYRGINTVRIFDHISEASRYTVTALVMKSASVSEGENEGHPGTKKEKAGQAGCADIYLTYPVDEKDLGPQFMLVTARKKRLRELDQAFAESEGKFSYERNVRYTVRMIMQEKGVDEDEAEAQLRSVCREYGYTLDDAANIVYRIFLMKDKS